MTDETRKAIHQERRMEIGPSDGLISRLFGRRKQTSHTVFICEMCGQEFDAMYDAEGHCKSDHSYVAQVFNDTDELEYFKFDNEYQYEMFHIDVKTRYCKENWRGPGWYMLTHRLFSLDEVLEEISRDLEVKKRFFEELRQK
jgi:hypothetical protein